MNGRILEGKERQALFSQTIDYYGIPVKEFDELAFIDLGKKVRVCSKQVVDFTDLNQLQGLGLLFLDRKSNKLATETIQLFGSKATKNFISLTEQESNKFLSRQDLLVDEERGKNLSNGYVVALYKGNALALGKYSAETKTLKPAIPKEIAAVFW